MLVRNYFRIAHRILSRNLEKWVSAAENSKNYKTRNEITGEISELKTKQRELESDLKELQKKDM